MLLEALLYFLNITLSAYAQDKLSRNLNRVVLAYACDQAGMKGLQDWG